MEEADAVTVVLDAGPLIHLYELGCSNLLIDFKQLLVPDSVWKETAQHCPESLKNQLLIRTIPPSNSLILDTISPLFMLHIGERDAISLSINYPGSILLSDDTAARMAAKSLGIESHGTIGIIIRALRKKLRTKEEIIQILSLIPEKSTLHIRPSLLRDIIKDII